MLEWTLWFECLCPSKSIHQNIINNMIIFGLLRWLNHKGRVLMKRISALIKAAIASPSTTKGHRKMVPSVNQKVGPHQTWDGLVP
jgi:hypothetical protein